MTLSDNERAALTDAEIVAIRDDHLPSQGEPFECVEFARAVLAAAEVKREIHDQELAPLRAALSERSAQPIPRDTDAAAKALYAKHTANDPIIHCNRFPMWDELEETSKNQYRRAADAAPAGDAPTNEQRTLFILLCALADANEICRSAAEIAKRDGNETNWQAFRKKLDGVLFRQHMLMNWEQYDADERKAFLAQFAKDFPNAPAGDALARDAELRAKYDELLYAVAKKFPVSPLLAHAEGLWITPN